MLFYSNRGDVQRLQRWPNTSKCSVKILYRSIKWYIGVFSSHKQDHQLRISSSAETKYFYFIFVGCFRMMYMVFKTTHNDFSSFKYQYIMHLTTFIEYSLSLSLPAWFLVVEIEVHFMTIRTPSVNKNYWPWRNTFHNFDRASITILVASNNFFSN